MRDDRKEIRISDDDSGISLVELIVVIAIMAVMVGITSLAVGMIFSRDANYVAVRIDDELTEARTLAMSRPGKFCYEFHIDSDPDNSYVRIIDLDNPDPPVRDVPLNKSVAVKVNGADTTDFSVMFDKAKGNVIKVNGSETGIEKVYTIEVTSLRNASKTKTVSLISTTGRHYTDK